MGVRPYGYKSKLPWMFYPQYDHRYDALMPYVGESANAIDEIAFYMLDPDTGSVHNVPVLDLVSLRAEQVGIERNYSQNTWALRKSKDPQYEQVYGITLKERYKDYNIGISLLNKVPGETTFSHVEMYNFWCTDEWGISIGAKLWGQKVSNGKPGIPYITDIVYHTTTRELKTESYTNWKNTGHFLYEKHTKAKHIFFMGDCVVEWDLQARTVLFRSFASHQIVRVLVDMIGNAVVSDLPFKGSVAKQQVSIGIDDLFDIGSNMLSFNTSLVPMFRLMMANTVNKDFAKWMQRRLYILLG